MDPVETIISNVGNFFYLAQVSLVADKHILFEKNASDQLVFSKPMIELMEDTHSQVLHTMKTAGMTPLQEAYLCYMADHVRYTTNLVLSNLGRSFNPPSVPSTRHVSFNEAVDRRIYTEEEDFDDSIDYDAIMGKYLDNDITSVQKFLVKNYAHHPDVIQGLTECNAIDSLLMPMWEKEIEVDCDFFMLPKFVEGDAHLPEDFFHCNECFLCIRHRELKHSDHFVNRIAIYLEHHVACGTLTDAESRDIYRHFFSSGVPFPKKLL